MPTVSLRVAALLMAVHVTGCFVSVPSLCGKNFGDVARKKIRIATNVRLPSFRICLLRALDCERSAALTEKAITKDAIATLQQQGYVIIDGAISGELAEKALEGCNLMNRNGKLQTIREQFALGRQDSMMVLDVWQEEWGPIPSDFQGMNLACEFLKGTASAISQHCPSHHKWSALCPPPYMQLALYAKTGAKYVRHLDNDPLDDRSKDGPVGLRVCDRVITALLYFNKDWKPDDGGYLRLYRAEAGRQEEVLLDVAPISGRLVLFESERFFHEVLPAYRQRWALSAWMTSTLPE